MAKGETLARDLETKRGTRALQKARKRDRVFRVRIRFKQVFFEALELGVAERTTKE